MEQTEQKAIDMSKIKQGLKPYSEKLKFKIIDIVSMKDSYRILIKAGKFYSNIPYTRVVLIGYEDNFLMIAISKEDIPDLLQVSKMLPKS